MSKRLLFISPRFLFPADEGGKIRTASILRALKGGAFEITLASSAPENWRSFSEDIDQCCTHFISWPQQRTGAFGKVLLLRGRLPIAVATDRSAAGRDIVASQMRTTPDVVVVDFPHAFTLLPGIRTDGAVVTFTHNVETEIYERHAAVADGIMRQVWRSQARKMAQFESEVLRNSDTVIAVSVRDAEMMTSRYNLSNVAVIDTGVDLDFYKFSPPPPIPPDGGKLVFCGAMDSQANIDGIAWMLTEVLPGILKHRPKVEFVVVGRNPPRDLVHAAKTRKLPVRFTGFVDDPRQFISDANVSVIPLRVGSGTRMKAFEAMALGRPVVSTMLGMEGLDVSPGIHFLAGNLAEEFAAVVLGILADPEEARLVSRAARLRLEEKFSWQHVASQFEAICLRSVAIRRAEGGDPPPIQSGTE